MGKPLGKAALITDGGLARRGAPPARPPRPWPSPLSLGSRSLPTAPSRAPSVGTRPRLDIPELEALWGQRVHLGDAGPTSSRADNLDSHWLHGSSRHVPWPCALAGRWQTGQVHPGRAAAQLIP